MRTCLVALVLAAGVAAAAERPEATSLLGQPLFRPPIADAARARMEADLAAAVELARREPSVEATIWLGRRTAYLGRFREAIAIYTAGLERYPDDARLLRHRGHRYITVREFDRAIADLKRAARLIKGRPDEVEPDGQPNARGIPTSTLHSNIWYHLALARYLEGDSARAAADWRRARDAAGNPDNLVAASHWLYTALRRSGRQREAQAVLGAIHGDLDVIENGGYHQLLLMYKGERTPEAILAAAAEGPGGSAARYGVSAWYLASGQPEEARKIREQILAGPEWPSFGYLAAEADQARARR